MLSTCLQFVTLFRGLSTTLVLYLGLGTVYLGVSFFFFSVVSFGTRVTVALAILVD